MRTRRLFFLIFALLVFAGPRAGAQQPAKVPRIGFLGLDDSSSPFFESFRQGLRDLGYLEGQNITVEPRFAHGNQWRLPELAVEMVKSQVDVIMTQSDSAVQAALDTTKKIPIVIAYCCDPVESGVVASVQRPGGNVTGISGVATELGGKWLELIQETIPEVKRVGVLSSRGSSTAYSKSVQVTARSLRIDLQAAEVRSPRDIEKAFTWATRGKVEALIVLVGTVFYQNQGYLADLALKRRLPALYWRAEFAEVGGLMAYGANQIEQFRRAAYFVDKIVKGAKPAELPVAPPTKFELVINLKTAKEIGVKIRPEVLMFADRVIK